MELYEVMRTTFSARDFTDDDVPDQVLFDVLDNARFAPSGGNRQGTHVVVVRDGATKDKLSKLCELPAKRYSAQVKAGETPWNTIHPTRVDTDTIAATPPPAALTQPLRQAPVVIVVLVDLSLVASLDQDLDRIGVVSGASVYPLVWNILLGLRQAGFGGTITTMASAREPQVQELLGAPSHYALAACLPIGKPLKQLTKLRRQPVSEFVTLETCDGPPLTI